MEVCRLGHTHTLKSSLNVYGLDTITLIYTVENRNAHITKWI